MPDYTITINMPYYINNVIDAIADAFPDVDFGNWYYDDEPCTLLGYEDGDYPPIDFFRCDKFYVEIDNFRTVRFEFDDKQQTVYKLDDEYCCDYFTSRLTTLLLHFDLPIYFIIDSYNDPELYADSYQTQSDDLSHEQEQPEDYEDNNEHEQEEEEPIQPIDFISQYNITSDDHFQELHTYISNTDSDDE